MAYALKGYSHFLYFLLKGLISDLSDDATPTDIRCALMKDTYTPDQDADEDYGDISADVIDSDATLDPDDDYHDNCPSGLEATLSPGGASVSVAGRVTTFDCADPTLADCTIGAYSCVFYDATPGYVAAPTDCKLIAYSGFGALKASNSGTYKIVVNASGLFTITVPA